MKCKKNKYVFILKYFNILHNVSFTLLTCIIYCLYEYNLNKLKRIFTFTSTNLHRDTFSKITFYQIIKIYIHIKYSDLCFLPKFTSLLDVLQFNRMLRVIGSRWNENNLLKYNYDPEWRSNSQLLQ